MDSAESFAYSPDRTSSIKTNSKSPLKKVGTYVKRDGILLYGQPTVVFDEYRKKKDESRTNNRSAIQPSSTLINAGSN